MDDIYIAHYENLLGRAKRLCSGTPLDAEDLMHSSFIRARTFWAKRNPEYDALSWLHRVLYSEFCDQLRTLRRRSAVPLDGLPLSIDDDPSYGVSLRDEAKALLAQLPIEYAKVLWLKAHGWTQDEIASCLGIYPGTVASRLHRGRELGKSLKENMKDGSEGS